MNKWPIPGLGQEMGKMTLHPTSEAGKPLKSDLWGSVERTLEPKMGQFEHQKQ